jgi:hypothetical protein
VCLCVREATQKKKLWRATCDVALTFDMGDDMDTMDIGEDHERDEDLITLLYLLSLLLCVLMGHSAYACLWLIALLGVADMVCRV